MTEYERDETNAAILVDFYKQTRTRYEFIALAARNGFSTREAQQAWFIIDRYADVGEQP